MGTLLEDLIVFVSPAYASASQIAPTPDKAAAILENHGATVALTFTKKVALEQCYKQLNQCFLWPVKASSLGSIMGEHAESFQNDTCHNG